jgi:hypothetical protein
VDLENVPASCCAHYNTPRVVATAIHGGDYRTCWCGGDIGRHDRDRPVTYLPGLVRDPEDSDEEDEDDE